MPGCIEKAALAVAASAVLVCLAPATAAAEPVDAPAEPPLNVRRPVPDYDGRGDDPVTAGEVLLWVPRILFSPLYVVSEYVVRWPLGKAISAAEEHKIPQKVQEFFTWGPNNASGIVPTALIDFGFRPSVGVYFFSDDWLYRGNGLRTHLAFGGVDWYRASVAWRHYFLRETPRRDDQRVELRFEYSHRPDWKFWGLGPRSSDDARSYYTAQGIDGRLSFRSGYWRSSRVDVWTAVSDVSFESASSSGNLLIDEAVALGFYPLPPLFDDGYTIARVGGEASFDSRPRRHQQEGEGSDYVSPPGSGVRLAVRGELAGGLRETPHAFAEPEILQFVRYGATVGGFLDILNQRVLGLQVMVDFVDPLNDGQIPFTELVSLGGSRPLRGFLQYRLLDRSSFAAVLEYTWPIWVWLDGAAHYGVGNVFGEHLDGFEAGLLRQSFGLGFRMNDERDHAFELLIASGSEPFDDGATPESFRFVLGATAGF